MMYDLEGYDHADIADILGIAVGTSRANLHHGRQALRKRLLVDPGTSFKLSRRSGRKHNRKTGEEE